MILLNCTSSRVAALALLLATAACSGGDRSTPSLGNVPQTLPAGEADAILALLEQGEVDGARKRIAAALRLQPMNPSILLLRDSVEGDPREQLGPNSQPYVTRPGDTMTALAERFLGNRLKAYQLSRYNGLANPADLKPGQTVRIPGDLPRSDPPRQADTRPASAPAAAARARPASPRPAVASKPAAPAPAPAPTADPTAARQARAAGLAALNGGNVGRAVALLGRAASLDPGNVAIAHDFARAQRIAATVRARQ